MDITELKRSRWKVNRHPWEIARVRIIIFLLKKQKKKFDHIADYGSGDAFVINKLVEAKIATSYSAIDTEYNTDIVNKLKGKNETIRFYQSQSEFEETEKKADLILMLDVLEHCKDDREVLKQTISSPFIISDKLNILITVPAFQSLFSQHDSLLLHYRRYNRKQLLQLCKNAGIMPIHSGYFFFSLLPLRIILLIVEKLKIRKTNNSIDNWRGGKWISNFIAALLWIDFRICYAFSNWGIHLSGLSCYCLCQKQQ